MIAFLTNHSGLRFQYLISAKAFERVLLASGRTRKGVEREPDFDADDRDELGPDAPLFGDRRTRVATDPTGEQPWEKVLTRERPDGLVSDEAVLNRDGTAIWSRYADDPHQTGWDALHTVYDRTGNSQTFETRGPDLTVRNANGDVVNSTTWTPQGVEPKPVVAEAYAWPLVGPTVAATLEAAGTLYTWWSSRNSADATAAFSYKASEFAPSSDGESPALWVGRLTRDEVDEACPRQPQVQAITDSAAQNLPPDAYSSAATYGTAVHKAIEQDVKALNDPQLRAEVSFIKSNDEKYGSLGSKRIDVLENSGSGTVCIYDIKTGASGLGPARMAELATTAQSTYPGTQRIIVIEMRPGR